MNILVVVDMQNDFVTGSLGSAEAVGIVEKVVSKVKNFNGKVIFTRDTHYKEYLTTQEGRILPVEHCIEGSWGWQIIDELSGYTDNIINKPAFGSIKLGEELLKQNLFETVESITVVGLCTDICVITNAFICKAFLREVPIIVDASCCAGSTPEAHINALNAMKPCQIMVINE